MIKNELWYLLIDGQQDAESGIVGNFYAYGNHLGDALDKTIKASNDYKFTNHNLTEASLLDNFDVIENNKELVKIADNVYMRPTTYTFPFDDPDKEFIPPIGIVKSVFEGEYEYDLIKENFVAYGADDNGIFEFELVLTKQNLIDTFIKTIEFLPTIDGFWIYLKNYWESDLTELWVAKHFTDMHMVIDFLKSQKKNTLENGYLDIVVHSLTGETNLTLDDHKKIQLHTKDEGVFNDFIGNIIELGYEQARDFYNLEFGYHHFHYRLVDSLTRTEFKQMLTDNKFELVDKWEE
ncbi:hypothetical protein ACFS5J_02370 [Flavobacterium chuncheonense]|uniref:Uncharacterized protein n=1 Tax=Flavobacterium chuncheonense TaxID=2026653 RepID=A0ABW5YIM6_9FLAO